MHISQRSSGRWFKGYRNTPRPGGLNARISSGAAGRGGGPQLGLLSCRQVLFPVQRSRLSKVHLKISPPHSRGRTVPSDDGRAGAKHEEEISAAVEEETSAREGERERERSVFIF